MSAFRHTVLLICTLLLPVAGSPQFAAGPDAPRVRFDDSDSVFSAAKKAIISDIIRQSAREVQALLPGLPDNLLVTVAPLDRDLASVGGVTGRADNPTAVIVYISTRYDGGVSAASQTGLAPVLYHEFHHLVRGWTIAGNRFGPGIPIAAVNEGLANVFSEIHTGAAFAGNAYPGQVDAWVDEVFALPVNASYSDWMVQHPDGRQAVGYKAGSYLVREAMAASGLSIIELSALPVADILELVGRSL